jgi:hypothetical protein
VKRLSLYSSADVLSRFILPWDQVTHFSYGPSYPFGPTTKITPHVLQVLEKLPNLADLHLVGGNVITQLVPIQLGQHITLSNLRTFEIHDQKLALLGQHLILDCLRAPLLQRFDLVISGEMAVGSRPYDHASRQLGPFLQTSSRLQKICIAFISGSGCHIVPFTGHPPPKTVYIWGKAPFFYDVFPQIQLNGRIRALDHWHAKVLDRTNAVSARDFVPLGRYVDRFLKPEDHSPPREQTTFDIHPVFYPFMKVFCTMLSGFTDDNLNVELYLQKSFE